MSTLAVAGGLLIGLATLLGAGLARGQAARRGIFLGAAAGALLVIAGLHLLPDAWSGARDAGIPVWIVPAAALASFAVSGLAVRRGCTCQQDRETAGGSATAGALAVHRLLEGAALVLSGSVAVAAALVVHAFAEGLAAGTLLSTAPRRQVRWWLAALCLSPLAGAVIADIEPIPERLEPVLLAVAAGVLGQAARVSLAAPLDALRRSRITPAMATLAAAVVTALAVHGVG